MVNGCSFCALIQEKDKAIFYEDPGGLFVALWTSLPASPGHTLVVPRRHLQRFRDMNNEEKRHIAAVVADVKDKIDSADLEVVCNNLEVISDRSARLIQAAQQDLQQVAGVLPEAFNDYINDGPAAGQTIPHLHWHILPRWEVITTRRSEL